jgi:hypothetical protein
MARQQILGLVADPPEPHGGQEFLEAEPVPVMGAHGGQELGALAELVQHLALHLGPDQRLVGMLAVDVDQGFS